MKGRPGLHSLALGAARKMAEYARRVGSRDGIGVGEWRAIPPYVIFFRKINSLYVARLDPGLRRGDG